MATLADRTSEEREEVFRLVPSMVRDPQLASPPTPHAHPSRPPGPGPPPALSVALPAHPDPPLPCPFPSCASSLRSPVPLVDHIVRCHLAHTRPPGRPNHRSVVLSDAALRTALTSALTAANRWLCWPCGRSL
ncbi:hypothetical protein HDU96_005094, partial [Phlyctochytrium bullatum]